MNCIIFNGGGAENRTPVQRTFLAGVFKLSRSLEFKAQEASDRLFLPEFAKS